MRFARRQPNCSSVSTSSGAVLLSDGSRFTANDARAAGGVDRVDAGLRPSRRTPSVPGASRRRSSRPACGRPGPATVLAGSGTRSWTTVAPRGRRPRVAPSSSADISGTNFDDRASWLSAGFQPLARTTSLPLPSGLLDDGGIAVLEPGQDAGLAERAVGMRRYFQKWILVKSLNCGAGERGEERVVEGDLAEHHVARTGASSTSRAGRPPGPRASRPGPGRDARRARSRRSRTYCRRARRSRAWSRPRGRPAGSTGPARASSGAAGDRATTLHASGAACRGRRARGNRAGRSGSSARRRRRRGRSPLLALVAK